ncbi:hypothetical protein [Pseudodesulfovibrio sediminis]|uniref:hypothetical protein n=1 Tax=Pseudodesulfovibrio sediminis TaxID=2810563 RepID=UPI001E637E10|nr:hypothetical protein [Pseudodesulfovibrio sediminis]
MQWDDSYVERKGLVFRNVCIAGMITTWMSYWVSMNMGVGFLQVFGKMAVGCFFLCCSWFFLRESKGRLWKAVFSFQIGYWILVYCLIQVLAWESRYGEILPIPSHLGGLNIFLLVLPFFAFSGLFAWKELDHRF